MGQMHLPFWFVQKPWHQGMGVGGGKGAEV